MPLLDRIEAVVREVIPQEANVVIRQMGDGAFDINISWPLNNDPNRPNKMSKTICVSVVREAVRDFLDAAPAVQSGIENRIRNFLNQRLAAFDPDHNVPRHQEPPIERCVVNSTILLG